MTASISFKKSHRQVSGNKKTLPVSRPVQALNRNHPKAQRGFWVIAVAPASFSKRGNSVPTRSKRYGCRQVSTMTFMWMPMLFCSVFLRRGTALYSLSFT